MLEELQNKYSDEGIERIGFILEDNSVVELVNAHDDPEAGAQFLSEELFAYLYDPDRDQEVVATWHTHPNQSSNLSGEDYTAFLNYPELDHYIIGNNGVSSYYVEDGVVKNG